MAEVQENPYSPEMLAYKTLAESVRPYLTELNMTVIIDACRDSVVDFCLRTQILEETQTAERVKEFGEKGPCGWYIEHPGYQFGVLLVVHDSTDTGTLTPEDEISTDNRSNIRMYKDRTFIEQFLDEPRQIKVRFTVLPLRDSDQTEFPKQIYNRYKMSLIYGACNILQGYSKHNINWKPMLEESIQAARYDLYSEKPGRIGLAFGRTSGYYRGGELSI